MMRTVSVVIPTLGRPSLRLAVQSVLDQVLPADEIIVVADTDGAVSMPVDDRIILLRSGIRSGAARCRQLGIDAASGTVIALLDDDDTWAPMKLARQLAIVENADDTSWIVSSRMAVVGPVARQRIWPRRLIRPGQPVGDYLFRFTDLRVGGAALQTSTLCFPTELARIVPWDTDADAIHDEPTWLMRVQSAVPDVRVLQLPDVLSTYSVAGVSVSRDVLDRTDAYIEWGLRHLGAESPRILGDYLCTSPVSAAVSASSIAGVFRALRSAIIHGRPGAFALAYAILNAARLVARATRPVAHR
jgi:glycosyltransferase involved in cell wall biosynthesis